MAGTEKLFLLVSPQAGLEAEALAIDAAKAAGVKHVVKLSTIGAGGDGSGGLPKGLGVHHLAMERKLEESGLKWTMLRPGFFMSNVLQWVQQIREKGEARNLHGDGLMFPIAPDDIAAVAALALTSEGHDGQTYALTGETAMTSPQQIEIMARVLGKKASVIDVPIDVGASEAKGRGAAEPVVAMLKDLWTNVRANRVATYSVTARVLLRRPLMTFEDWFRLRVQKL
jgi:uncharacterized protein YbjT (DUF2867 family)